MFALRSAVSGLCPIQEQLQRSLSNQVQENFLCAIRSSNLFLVGLGCTVQHEFEQCFEAFLVHLLQPEADTGVSLCLVPAVRRQLLLRFKKQRVLRALVHATAQPGSCRSLLTWHTSSQEAQAQEFSKRSLLHVAAVRDLVQVCALLLGEGFDVNVHKRYDSVTRDSCPQ